MTWIFLWIIFCTIILPSSLFPSRTMFSLGEEDFWTSFSLAKLELPCLWFSWTGSGLKLAWLWLSASNYKEFDTCLFLSKKKCLNGLDLHLRLFPCHHLTIVIFPTRNQVFSWRRRPMKSFFVLSQTWVTTSIFFKNRFQVKIGLVVAICKQIKYRCGFLYLPIFVRIIQGKCQNDLDLQSN